MKRFFAAFLALAVAFNPIAAQAQMMTGPVQLPSPGSMVKVSPAFTPTLLRGVTIHPDNPLKFDFIVDQGDAGLKDKAFKAESQRMVNYFLAALTIPEKDMWVNLSPVEKDRIIPDALIKTELGRDLLAQDYILKQLTASLIYPQDELGKAFWARVYAQAYQQFGMTDIPVGTFNKVWIIPEQASVVEKGNTVYIAKAHLKVMLESDYMAEVAPDMKATEGANRMPTQELTKQILREIIVPAIEKEVNEGKNFASLRQVFYAMVLAQWYQDVFKKSILNKLYAGKGKIAGIDVNDPKNKEMIYQQYMAAYQKGVFNFIKEEEDRLTHQPLPKKYFSGGFAGQKVKRIPVDMAQDAQTRHLECVCVEVKTEIVEEEATRLFDPKEKTKEEKLTASLNVLQALANIGRALKNKTDVILAKKQMPPAKVDPNTWMGQNAPAVGQYTIASLQFEAGLDRGLMEKLIDAQGEGLARIIGQTTMTGGLGALMHDLVVGWKKNGADMVAIHPIYNEIKGAVSGLGKDLFLGDRIRQVLDKTDARFTIKLQGEKFAQQANIEEARKIIGKEIFVDVYKAKTKFGGTPLYYVDPYYLNDQDIKTYIFDQLYPDNDWRDIQMAVYNQASQRLLRLLQEWGEVKEKILFVENEVFVSLPKNEFEPETTIRHHINHTVWKPGMYRPKEYSLELLGFGENMRSLIVHNGEIWIAEYAALTCDFISGVALYEHTDVLKNAVLSPYRNNIWQYYQKGLRNTNGALLDMWQGVEIRGLIDGYKDKLGLNALVDDNEFFDALNDEDKINLQREFTGLFEHIKALYALDLLLYLRRSQPQEMGGSEWLADVLGGSKKYKLAGIQKIRDQYAELLGHGLVPGSETLDRLNEEYGDLRDILLQSPVVANIRRQVAYKGPDKYRDMFELFKKDGVALKAFRDSGTRLIIGGRAFGKDAISLFQELKARAKSLGLQDRVALIENYNIADAVTLFRGVAGSVMLSDEFLEASATSMMKVITNGGTLLGVWGGADPELFDIVEVATGDSIDILKEKITHDGLVAGLAAGKYVMTNGYLVEYSADRSREDFGGRRPSLESLVKGLMSVGHTAQASGSRQAQFWNNLRNSYRVDIERGQARAHIELWDEAITRKEAFQKLIGVIASDPDVASMFEDNGPSFDWQSSYGRSIFNSSWRGEGLSGFLTSFEELRASDARFMDAMYHHLDNGNPEGDVLAYVTAFFKREPVSPRMRYLREFLTTMYQSESKIDSAQNTGGIDLRKVGVDRQGHLMADVITEKAIENMLAQASGVHGVIMSITPIRDIGALLH